MMTISAAFTANPVVPISVPGGMEPTEGPGGGGISRPVIRTRSSPSTNESSTTANVKVPAALVWLAGIVMLKASTAP